MQGSFGFSGTIAHERDHASYVPYQIDVRSYAEDHETDDTNSTISYDGSDGPDDPPYCYACYAMVPDDCDCMEHDCAAQQFSCRTFSDGNTMETLAR